MYDYELPEIRDFDLLNNLMKNKENSDIKKLEVNDSDIREKLIVQMIKDELNLDINKDPRFTNTREIFFVRVSLLNQVKKVIKQDVFLSKKEMEFDFIIDKILKYHIIIENEVVKVNRILLNDDNEEYKNRAINGIISLKSDPSQIQRSNDNISNKSTNSRNDKKFIYYCRIFKDRENYIEVKHTKHEVDGNLRTKDKIENLEKILKDNLYYPLDRIINLDEGEHIIVEVKQNTSLKILLEQMKKLIDDFKLLLPNEKYTYFGFVNEETAKKDIENEKEFIDKIGEFLNENTNFKIFLFLIKNNKFLRLNLSDEIDYPTHFYNLIGKKIDDMNLELKEINRKIDTIIKALNIK